LVELKHKRAVIYYRFEELPDGGRVRIKTGDHDALNAIDDLLTFQIEDHHTTDTANIAPR